MRCGWGKVWDPPTVTGCIDPRGCPVPPTSTSTIYSSYDTDSTKLLDVGTKYWYSCNAGEFQIGTNNFSSNVHLTCINDPSGGPPYWDPPYDGVITPFPTCVLMRKYFVTQKYIELS